MDPTPASNASTTPSTLDQLEALRAFNGRPAEFWPRYSEAMAGLAGAEAGLVLLRQQDDPAGWKQTAPWPSVAGVTPLLAEAESVAEDAVRLGTQTRQLEVGTAAGPDASWAVAVRLTTDSPGLDCVALFLLKGVTQEEAEAVLPRLRLSADMPATLHLRRALDQAKADVTDFATVLELLSAMDAEKKFLAVSMVFVNELAARHGCERVALGWLEKDRYIRVHALSHAERFEKKMEAVRAIECVMEEALDQDDEIVWPAPEDSTLIHRDHETYAREAGIPHVCSVPLRKDGDAVAVVTCEREARPFTETEMRVLRLSCDLAVSRLADLKRRDRWFGARWAGAAREKLGALVGVEHTWVKLTAVLVSLALGVLFFGKAPYRVEAPFILRAENLVHVPSPFDGFIDQALVEPGDAVEAGDVLLELDTRDLLLEEAAALADRDRYVRQGEKARADGALADMQIAMAQAEQAKARLELVQYRLEQAAVAAPFDAVVVEGDLKERAGAPVTKGEVLFRLARMDEMYVRCEVSERSAHEVRPDAAGRIAFASEPRLKFPVRVVRIDPVARAKEGDNVFNVRCDLEEDIEEWWKPGMSGVAKIDAGRRHIFWIFMHRTVDFLRMKLWW